MTKIFNFQRLLVCLLMLGVLSSWTLPPSRLIRTGGPKNPTRAGSPKRQLSNDPLGFTMRSNKATVGIEEPLVITITARHLAIPPSLLFTFESDNAYRLKLLLPQGFVVTGGTYYDMVGGTLGAGQAPDIYTVEGYFSQIPEQTQFRLLRSGGQATSQSLFIEKSQMKITVLPYQDGAGRLAAGCTGISLTASASPASVAVGGQTTLSASCQGCTSSASTLVYSTSFENDTKGVTFELDDDQQNIYTNAQEMQTYLCPVGDRLGNPTGKLYVYAANNAGRLWQKSFGVVSGNTYTFSLWVRPIYNGQPGAGRARAVELVVNGQVVQASTVDVMNNANCSKGWVQLSGSWTANTTANVPFVFRTTQADGWQSGFGLDDISITSSGGGSSASYSWQALDGGSIASPTAATTSVTLPTTAGTKRYQVTLTSGSCSVTKIVAVTVTQCVAPSLSITSTTCNGSTYSAAFSASANATIQASAGTVQGNQVINIPSGSALTITASLNGCSSTATASTPCPSGSWQIDGDEYILNEY